MTIAGAFALCGQAPAPPDSLAVIKAQVQSVTRHADGSFSGPAWNKLVDDGASAQFVMVGEQHGSGDIARFISALHQQLARRGFTHSALEVGPYSIAVAERLIRSGKGDLQRYIATPGQGFTFPFLLYAEEAELAEQMVSSSPDRQQALFGLDQEFVGAGPVLASELRKLAFSPAERQAVAAFDAHSKKDRLFVARIEDDQLDALSRTFRSNQPALGIIEAMRKSARIYRPFVTRVGSGYLANLERETYMKTNFLRQFETATHRNGRPPKVFFKFGGNHAMRGMSGTNVPALGNFLAEWGLSKNYSIVNIMVDCRGGEIRNSQDGTTSPCPTYFPDSSLLYKALSDDQQLQILDLRPLRQRVAAAKDVDEVTRKTILAFDYYIVVRGSAPATHLGVLNQGAENGASMR